jgi:hypothetical protein
MEIAQEAYQTENYAVLDRFTNLMLSLYDPNFYSKCSDIELQFKSELDMTYAGQL